MVFFSYNLPIFPTMLCEDVIRDAAIALAGLVIPP